MLRLKVDSLPAHHSAHGLSSLASRGIASASSISSSSGCPNGGAGTATVKLSLLFGATWLQNDDLAQPCMPLKARLRCCRSAASRALLCARTMRFAEARTAVSMGALANLKVANNLLTE
jgi:hypothetical protein